MYLYRGIPDWHIRDPRRVLRHTNLQNTHTNLQTCTIWSVYGTNISHHRLLSTRRPACFNIYEITAEKQLEKSYFNVARNSSGKYNRA